MGIARCFTFGGRFNRVLHDPSVKPRDSLTKQAYMDKTFQQTTINHFHEKLLKLKVRCITLILQCCLQYSVSPFPALKPHRQPTAGLLYEHGFSRLVRTERR